MVHYQYFVLPKTDLTTKRLNEMPTVRIYDELESLYSLDLESLKTIFELKFNLQGTGGRASKQPISFLVYRRLGNDGTMKKLSPAQIEILLRQVLKVKPAYLQRAGLLTIKNRS